MAGALTVSTLKDDTGVLATQNGMTGIPKAWVRFTTTTTPSVTNSFNISSVTYSTNSIYTINFSTAMPNANYAIVTGGNYNNTVNNYAYGGSFYSLSRS